MNKKVRQIIDRSRSAGWVLEPLAKELLCSYRLRTSRFFWARSEDEARKGARDIGYPVVVKIVSPDVVHKSDVNGVLVGIGDDSRLIDAYRTMSGLPGFEGILIDEMVSGTELIIGAKNDPQFGPVVLTGIGGTSVEIYRDVAIRMAPVERNSALEAVSSLKGAGLLKGYRGREPVNLDSVADLIVSFSDMVYKLRDVVESIDLNPVMCNSKEAVIADARIILKS